MLECVGVGTYVGCVGVGTYVGVCGCRYLCCSVWL